MNTEQFFDAILPAKGRRVAGHLSKDKRFSHYFEPDNAALATAVGKIDAKLHDAYFACATYGAENKRTKANVVAVRSFWLDIDTQEGKPAAHYVSRKTALLALEDYRTLVGLPKPWVVSSGYGIHAYWPTDADIEPDIWLDTAKLLKASAGLAGLDIDNSRTTDSASVLRPPETHNRKHDPAKLVKVVQVGETTTHGELRHRWEQHAPAQGLAGSAPRSRRTGSELNADLMLPPPEFPPAHLKQIAEQCAVMRHVRDTRGNVDQPTWYHALQLIGATVEAETAIHDYSDGYPGNTAAETDATFRRASQHGPTSCAKFADHQPRLCQGCPHFGKITSPISLGSNAPVAMVAADDTAAPQFPVSSVQDFRPMALTTFPSAMAGDDPRTIELANRLFVMIAFSGGQVFGPGLIGPNGDIQKLDPATGKTLTANIRVRIATGDATKYLPLYDFWLHHPQRLTFNDAVFCPPFSDAVLTPGSLNTYRGLGVEGLPGQCLRILRHVYCVIANGDRRVFMFLIKFIAHMMVKPGERAGVAIILQGEIEGGGKSLFLNLIARLVGDHALSVPTTDRLSSRFNAQVENKIVVVCHEGLLGVGHGQANKLKSEITDPYIEVEGKGRDVRVVANYARYLLATNEAFPVRSGKGARRFLVCKTSSRYVGNRAYFDALRHEIDNGGAEAFLHFLQHHVPLEGFNPSADMPRTEALSDQQEFSAAPHVKWALDVADGADGMGTFRHPLSHFDNPEPITFGQPISYQAIHDNFRRWSADTGERCSMTVRGLSRWLREGLKLPTCQVGQNRLKGCVMPATAADFDRIVRTVEGIG